MKTFFPSYLAPILEQTDRVVVAVVKFVGNFHREGTFRFPLLIRTRLQCDPKKRTFETRRCRSAPGCLTGALPNSHLGWLGLSLCVGRGKVPSNCSEKCFCALRIVLVAVVDGINWCFGTMGPWEVGEFGVGPRDCFPQIYLINGESFGSSLMLTVLLT